MNACSMVACSTASQTTSETCSVVNMGRYQSMVAAISIGSNGVTTSNLYVLQQAAVTTAPTATTAVYAPFNYRYNTTAQGEVLSARAAGATTAATVMNSTAGIYLVEIKSDDLKDGFPYVSVSVSSAAAQRAISVTYVMKPRYPQNVLMLAVS
jgi:hypothetical protein